jgi:hypothetical protein
MMIPNGELIFFLSTLQPENHSSIMRTFGIGSHHQHQHQNENEKTMTTPMMMDQRERKSFHIISLPNTYNDFYLPASILDVTGFQIKDISFDSGALSLTSPRLFLESHALANIANTAGSSLNFFIRNPEHMDHADQPCFYTPCPKTLTRLDFALYDGDGNVITLSSSHKVQISLEFTHKIQDEPRFM